LDVASEFVERAKDKADRGGKEDRLPSQWHACRVTERSEAVQGKENDGHEAGAHEGIKEQVATDGDDVTSKEQSGDHCPLPGLCTDHKDKEDGEPGPDEGEEKESEKPALAWFDPFEREDEALTVAFAEDLLKDDGSDPGKGEGKDHFGDVPCEEWRKDEG